MSPIGRSGSRTRTSFLVSTFVVLGALLATLVVLEILIRVE
jgi:hypothetical protein